MAGGHSVSDQQFTGWQKTFNAVTPRGRLHCAYASLGFWTAVFLAIKFRPRKSTQPAAIKS